MLTGKYPINDINWFTVELILDGDFDLALRVVFSLEYCESFQVIIKLSDVPPEKIGWEAFQDYLEERFVRPRLEELKKKCKDLWRIDLPPAADFTMALRIRPEEKVSSEAEE